MILPPAGHRRKCCFSLSLKTLQCVASSATSGGGRCCSRKSSSRAVEEEVEYLLEGELDGLVLAQLQDVHQLHDGLVASVQLVLALDQLLLLLGEVDKLVQRLLVDVAVLLQLRVALLQLPEELEHGERGGEEEERDVSNRK